MLNFIKKLFSNTNSLFQTKILPCGKSILESIKKLFKGLTSSETEYVSLTPDDKITNGTEYLKALKWAIKGKKATNIALSGPYGSGKSSVIETFLKNNKCLRKRSIKISMATFVGETLDDKEVLEQKRIKLEKDEIERGILKQLFYKVNHKKIPQSRYRKLHRISFGSVFVPILFSVIACLIIVFVFWPSALETVANKIIAAGNTVKLPELISLITVNNAVKLSKWISLIAATLFCLVCLGMISKLYINVLSRLTVKEVKLPKDLGIQMSTGNQDSVFNKNMDEIVYFFEETKYRIVFFEDLDRLHDTSVFIHLRELNIILNNYDTIKKPIIFVYAVKDDIFTDVDRTKFFDFIIPVVPIINSTNSGEILLQKLAESKRINREHNISESFVLDVSPFINDMRILQNIYNEFVVYKSTLTTGQSLKLLDEPMLALIIFKNLYPRDFAKLQREEGIVKQTFRDKDGFISIKKQELQERIDASTEVLENIQSELFDTRKSLKCAFLCKITNFRGIARSFTPLGCGSVSATDFLTDDYEIPNWSGIDTCRVSFSNFNGNWPSPLDMEDFSKAYENFIQNYSAVALIEDNKIEEEKSKVEDLRRQIYELSFKSLSELIEVYGINAILSEDVKANDLLVFLLRRGYIDEEYADYINYFKATTITTEDMNYILGIKNLTPKPYDHKLTRTDLVIKRLQPYEFEQEAIYNFDLLEYLLCSDQYDDKLDLYIRQLSNGSDASWKFIDEFIDITDKKERFINILARNWHTMWDNIFSSSTLTLDRKFYYLSLLISYASIKSIKSMDANGNLTVFFVSNSDVLQRLSSVEDQKIIDVITSLEIKFVDIQIENVSASILDYIFDNNFYSITFEMIQHIVEYKDKKLVSRLRTKNYSTLLELNYPPLLRYIEDNIAVYTDDIVLLLTNTEEDIDAIVKLLELNVDSECRHIQIIGNQNFYVEDITAICLNIWKEHKEYVRSIWNAIITNGKLKPTWENLNAYWYHSGHTDVSIAYMSKNVDALMKEDSTCIDDESLIKELIESDMNHESLAKLLSKLPWSGFNIPLNTLDESKISILISLRYFEFNVERYNELVEVFPGLRVEFIIQNQNEYMNDNDQIDMDSELLESLLFDKRFTRSNAQKLIEDYGEEYATSKIAKKINALGVTINIDVFDVVWNLLGNKEKEFLMLENLDILDADKFEMCFSELGNPYKEFSDRKYRHDVHLSNTEPNLRLAKRLEKIAYITSFQYKEKTRYDSEKKEFVPFKIISCRVKATE